MLNKIREEIGRTEVTYERIRELKGVMTSVQIESVSFYFKHFLLGVFL